MRRYRPGKPFALTLGAAFTLVGAVHASVFQANDLPSGYMLAAADETKSPAPEAKCGANCEQDLIKAGSSAANAKTACDKARAEGKCGSAKEKAEGKCGEGKCGGTKK